MTMQRLLYTSRIVESHRVRGSELARRIAEASARSNDELGLTGSLAFIDGHFIQVLEGEQRPLEAIFERICCDFRHCDLKLIDCQSVTSRQFAEWGMACLVDDVNENRTGHEALSQISLLSTLNAREAVNQMRRILDQHWPSTRAA